MYEVGDTVVIDGYENEVYKVIEIGMWSGTAYILDKHGIEYGFRVDEVRLATAREIASISVGEDVLLGR
jgi:hypothetical protein